MLIIEIDGITHTYEKVAKYDLIRQKKLESIGFQVLRFDDDDVLRHINQVRDLILLKMEDQIRRFESK